MWSSSSSELYVGCIQSKHEEGMPPVLPTFLASTANTAADWVLPGGTYGKGAGHVLAPHTTLPLVDNSHLNSANSLLKSKCAFAQNSKI